MKNRILVFLLTSVTLAQADPEITSWVTSISARYARIYASTANRSSGVSSTTWSGQTSPAYAGVNEIDSSANWVYIRSTGLGAHAMGPWNNPNLPKNQQLLWRFPRTPTVAATNRVSTALTQGGAIGLFADGVAAFNMTDGFSYSWPNSEDASPITSIGPGDGIWNRDAYVNEAVSFDYALAHNQQQGEYHYHVNPVSVRYLTGDNVLYNSSTKQYSENTANTSLSHSPILGWMKDGLPVYGPYGYDGSGTGASATASLNSTTVGSVSVNAAGKYFTTPAISFSGGGGTGAAASVTMKAVSALIASANNSSAGGTGYKVGDTLTVSGGTSTTVAKLTVATITGGGSTGPIGTLTVNQAGSYTVIPPNYISVTGGTGSGALPTVTWGVNAITVTSAGAGYSSAPTVTVGGVRRMVSGYQLRDGTNGTTNLNATSRTTLPGWALTAQGRGQINSSQTAPSVSSVYALGHYWEDYDYLGDHGYTQGSRANSGGVFFDLDICNTRFCITPDYPNGTWAYFITIKADGTSAFPYEVGRWYRGNPGTGGGATTSTVMNADTPLTQNFLGGANTALNLGTPKTVGGTVTLTWSAVEGGAYSVSASTNDVNFTSVKTGVTAPSVPIAPTVGDTVTAIVTYNDIGSAGTEWGKVTRTALGTYDSAGQTGATLTQSATASYSDLPEPALLITENGSSVANGSEMDFGTVLPDEHVAVNYTLQNIGNATLNLSNVSVAGSNPGDFQMTTSPATTLAPSQSTTLSITFAPGALAERTATLSMTSNDPANLSYQISLLAAGSLGSTSPATAVASPFATLNGSVNPDGKATTAYFEFGASTSYGSNTGYLNLGSGSADVPVSFNVNSLTKGVTYHYQLVVVSGGITYYGGDQTFTTTTASTPSWHSAQITALTDPNANNMADGARPGAAHTSWSLYFYKGTDNNLWAVFPSNGTWDTQKLTTSANVSDWLAFASTYNTLCYQGIDGNLWCVYYNAPTNQWQTLQLGSPPQGVTVAGGIVVDTYGGWNNIYYRGSDSHLYAAYFNGSAWVHVGLGGTATIKGNLAIQGNNHLIYYQGTDNNLWCFYYNGKVWSQLQLTTTGNVGGTVAVDNVGLLAYYKSNTDTSAWCTYSTGGPWTPLQLDAAANLSTSATSFSNIAPYPINDCTVYLDNNGQGNSLYWNGSQWVHVLLGDGGWNLTGGLSLQPINHWLFARRSDGNVVIFYID